MLIISQLSLRSNHDHVVDCVSPTWQTHNPKHRGDETYQRHTGQQIEDGIESKTHEQKGKTELHLPLLFPPCLHTNALTQQANPLSMLFSPSPTSLPENEHKKQREFMNSFRPANLLDDFFSSRLEKKSPVNLTDFIRHKRSYYVSAIEQSRFHFQI